MLSKMSDPYCCKITISRLDRIGPVTVGHIPREISRYVYYFLAMDGVVSGTVINTQYSHSPIPAGGLEVPLWLTFAHRKKWIIDRLRDFRQTDEDTVGDDTNWDSAFLLETDQVINDDVFPAVIIID